MSKTDVLPFDVRLPIYNDETIAAFEEAIKLSNSNDKNFSNTRQDFMIRII